MKINSPQCCLYFFISRGLMMARNITILLAFLFLSASFLKAQPGELKSGVYHLDSMEIQNGIPKKTKLKVLGSTSDLAMLNIHSSTLEPGKTNHPPRALMDREELIIVKEGPLTITK